MSCLPTAPPALLPLPYFLLPARPFHLTKRMKEEGLSPSYIHLRSICNYTDHAFDSWLDRTLAAAVRGADSTTTSRTPGSSTDEGSVRTETFAELGISYAAVPPRRARSPAITAATREAMAVANSARVNMKAPAGSAAMVSTATTADEEQAFAPGRTEARALVGELASGLEVLDLYCGTGGFALNAARNGARSVLGVRTRMSGLLCCVWPAREGVC